MDKFTFNPRYVTHVTSSDTRCIVSLHGDRDYYFDKVTPGYVECLRVKSKLETK